MEQTSEQTIYTYKYIKILKILTNVVILLDINMK